MTTVAQLATYNGRLEIQYTIQRHGIETLRWMAADARLDGHLFAVGV